MGRKLHNQNRQFGVLRLNNRLKKTVFYSVLLSCKIAKRENVVLLSGLFTSNPSWWELQNVYSCISNVYAVRYATFIYLTTKRITTYAKCLQYSPMLTYLDVYIENTRWVSFDIRLRERLLTSQGLLSDSTWVLEAEHGKVDIII